MRDTGVELAWLGRAPLAAAAIVVGAGFVLASTAAALGAPTPLVLGIAIVGALAGWFAAVRVGTVTRAAGASIESVTSKLEELARGRRDDDPISHELSRDLVAAYAELADRVANTEKLAKADRVAAQETDMERLAFLADFSHELRTPLNSILGFAHVLDSESEGPLDEDGREAVAIILASGEQLNALVEDVLDLTALETGKIELRPRAVDLGQLARQVTRAAGVVAAQKALPLHVTGEERVIGMGDEKRLKRMLWNVITRAIRATERGAVDVSVRGPVKKDGVPVVTITVSDEGRPMSAAERQALLTGSTDESASKEGLGIGLGVVGRLLVMHGGSVAIDSGNAGTRVELTLPAATNEEVSWAVDNRPSLIGDPEDAKRKGTRRP